MEKLTFSPCIETATIRAVFPAVHLQRAVLISLSQPMLNNNNNNMSGQRRLAGAPVACGLGANVGEERRERSAATDSFPAGQCSGAVP